MTENIKVAIKCSDCEEILPSELAHDSTQYNCPKCGSIKKIIIMEVIEDVNLEIHDQMQAKIKNDNLPSNKKVRKEMISGDEKRKDNDTWVNKERVIDRDEDFYKEKVTDLKTGKVLRDIEEPLSKHINRGSAKLKKD